MAKITVNPEYNLPLIAENAGQGDIEKRLYRDGQLHVEGVTQKALDDALAAYDHAQDAFEVEPNEIEILKDVLREKGVITDEEISDKRLEKINAVRGNKI